jgi:signal transduction histidine kinase
MPVSPWAQNHPQLEALEFSITSNHSLASIAYTLNIHHCSLDKEHLSKLSVADQQLARFLKVDALLYLPLSTRESQLGLIAVGVDQDQWQALSQQKPLLDLFVREAANMLQRQQNLLSYQKQIIEDERASFELEAKKVVHEANNPLTIINNYLHILGMKLGDDHKVREEIDIIKEEISRVGKILLRIRDIPDELDQQSRTVDINQLIEDLYRLFQSSIFPVHGVSATLDLDSNLPHLARGRGHIKQILTNLIKNSVEAMEKGGKLSIETHANAYLNGKQHIEIQIADNGPGIDAEIMDKLFSPVTTTKGSNHSGLGLTIVKNLIDELVHHTFTFLCPIIGT